MIRENNTYYIAEWIDNEDYRNEKYLGDSMDKALTEAYKLRDENGIQPFIVEVRKTNTVIMQVRKQAKND